MIKQTLLIIIAVVFCNAAFSQSDEKANILAVERSTADAFTKHNLVYLTSVFADDINVITATGEVVNKQQLLQSVQSINSATVSNMQVKILNNISIVTGVEIETGKDANGSAYQNKMRFTDVLQKTKGVWQIITSQATVMQE